MQEIGKLDLDSTISTLLSPNGEFAIEEDEFSTLLNSLGLSQMTIEEAQANPEVLLAAYKKKILTITEQVQAVTTDQNQALRMIFAGVKFGDINQWNYVPTEEEKKNGAIDISAYTMAALNSYYSGDKRALEKLERKYKVDAFAGEAKVDLQSGELIQVYEDPGNDLGAIEKQLAELDANEPPKLIKTGNVPNTLGLIAQTQVNREYTAWSRQKQLLNDRALFINQSAQGFVQPTDQGAVLSAGKRIVGDTRYSELQNKVIEKFPNLKVHPEYGYIYDPARGNARIGTKVFEAKDMMQTLLLNEVIGGQSINESDIIDKDNVLETPLVREESAYKLGSKYAGKFDDKDLVSIKGYNESGTGRTVRIRKDVAQNLESMLDAAAKEGIYLNFSDQTNYSSGYRPFEESILAYVEDKSKAAVPGYSTHNLGTAVDFEWDKNDLGLAREQLEWVQENGPKYGFFGFSKGGEGTDIKKMQNKKIPANFIERNVFRKGKDWDTYENWHFDYRPDLMETN